MGNWVNTVSGKFKKITDVFSGGKPLAEVLPPDLGELPPVAAVPPPVAEPPLAAIPPVLAVPPVACTPPALETPPPAAAPPVATKPPVGCTPPEPDDDAPPAPVVPPLAGPPPVAPGLASFPPEFPQPRARKTASRLTGVIVLPSLGPLVVACAWDMFSPVRSIQCTEGRISALAPRKLPICTVPEACPVPRCSVCL